MYTLPRCGPQRACLSLRSHSIGTFSHDGLLFCGTETWHQKNQVVWHTLPIWLSANCWMLFYGAQAKQRFG